MELNAILYRNERALQRLHTRLAAFCERWVPSGAEAEKVAILEQLRELEEAVGVDGPSEE